MSGWPVRAWAPSRFLLLLSNCEGEGPERTELDAGGLVISISVSQTSTMGHEQRDLVIVGC